MSSRVTIKKGKVGMNVLGGYEKVSALVGSFGVVGSGDTELKTGESALLSSVNDIASYGINEKDNALLHHHITEYFRVGGRGTRLYVLNLENADSYASMIEADAVKKMIVNAQGQIFNLAFSYIPASGEIVSGLNEEMLPAIKAAQVLADWTREKNCPLHIVLECAGLENVKASSMLNLREIKVNNVLVECPQVSIMIGQDWDFAETLTGTSQKYAAVGTLLGCMAAQPVSYNVGEVATMVLTDANRGDWVNAGLSSHEKVRDVDAQLDGLNDKGYILGEYYSGVVCINDDHVCTPVVVDKDGNMNESTIALSRVNNKVARELYAAYLPMVKSTVPVNPTTGKMDVGMIKYFEDIGNNVFSNMAARQELSAGETEVDADSNLLVGDKALKVYYSWVGMGCISRIDGTVNIKTSL